MVRRSSAGGEVPEMKTKACCSDLANFRPGGRAWKQGEELLSLRRASPGCDDVQTTTLMPVDRDRRRFDCRQCWRPRQGTGEAQASSSASGEGPGPIQRSRGGWCSDAQFCQRTLPKRKKNPVSAGKGKCDSKCTGNRQKSKKRLRRSSGKK